MVLWQSISTNVSGMSNRTNSVAMAIISTSVSGMNNRTKSVAMASLYSISVSGMSSRTKSVAMAIYFNQCLWNEQQDKQCCYDNLSYEKCSQPDIAWKHKNTA